MALNVQETAIVDGPQIHIWVSAWMLYKAKEADQRISVQVKLDGRTVKVRIAGLHWEEGSDNDNIFFQGYVPHTGRVDGFFDLQRRKGWIKFL